MSPPVVSSMVMFSCSRATSSTASTATDAGPVLIMVGGPSVAVTGLPPTRTSVAVNLGDQFRPARDPLSPGRPTHPVQRSGSSARRIGSSTTLGPPGSMLERTSPSASASSSVSRSAPQCTMAGSCPAEMSSTSETPSDRRAITQLARPTMVTPSIGALSNVYPTEAALTLRELLQNLPSQHFSSLTPRKTTSRKNSEPPSTTGWFAFQAVIPASAVTVHPETAGSIAEALTLTLPQ